MLHGQPAHGNRALDHDAVDITVLYPANRVGKIIKSKNLDGALAVGKFMFGKDLGRCRTSDLADTKETLEVRMRTEYRLRHRDRLGQVIFGALGINNRYLRISCQCFLYASDSFVEV